MKSKLTYLAVLIAVAVLYAGCGSDTVTGGNNSPQGYEVDSVFWHVDSITDFGGDSIATGGGLPLDTNWQGVKVTFTASSNNANIFFSLFAIGSNGERYRLEKTGAAANGTFEAIIDMRGSGSDRNLYFYLGCLSQVSSDYIKAVNVTYSRIHYTQ